MERSIWEKQAEITRQLSAWAALSLLIGGILNLGAGRHEAGRQEAGRFRKGVGVQFAGWGFVNALIALFGGRAAEKRKARLPNPYAAETVAGERTKLRRLLAVNAVLDVFYMLGGWYLARGKGSQDRFWRGQGWGIMIQGAFLFFFDTLHALFLQERGE